MIDRSIVVVLLGSAGFTALSKIVISYLHERKKDLVVRFKDGSFEVISKNFNQRDIEKIISRLRDQAIIQEK